MPRVGLCPSSSSRPQGTSGDLARVVVEAAGESAPSNRHRPLGRGLPSCPLAENCMTETPATAPDSRSIWVRGLLMILMALAFQIAATLLALGGIVQFVLAVVS